MTSPTESKKPRCFGKCLGPGQLEKRAREFRASDHSRQIAGYRIKRFPQCFHLAGIEGVTANAAPRMTVRRAIRGDPFRDLVHQFAPPFEVERRDRKSTRLNS